MASLPPHVPEYVSYGMPAPRSKSVSMDNITVPLILVFFGAAGLVSATYFATRELSDISNSLQSISRDVTDVRTTVNRKLGEYEEELSKRTADRWSKTDHDIWCAKTEVINSAIGWKCAPVTYPAANVGRIRDFPSISGWATRSDPRRP